MTIAQRRTIRARYAFRCGYCALSETDIGAELTIDHFQPRSRGGSDDNENLVYACHACNEFKGDWWPPDDTPSNAPTVPRLLHPLRDDLSAHLEENNDGTLRGLTAEGENFIVRLRLNRPALCAHRRAHREHENARRTQQELLQRLQRLEQQVQSLTTQLEDLASGQ